MLHLHCFQHQQCLSAGNFIAIRHAQLHHASRHRGSQDATLTHLAIAAHQIWIIEETFKKTLTNACLLFVEKETLLAKGSQKVRWVCSSANLPSSHTSACKPTPNPLAPDLGNRLTTPWTRWQPSCALSCHTLAPSLSHCNRWLLNSCTGSLSSCVLLSLSLAATRENCILSGDCDCTLTLICWMALIPLPEPCATLTCRTTVCGRSARQFCKDSIPLDPNPDPDQGVGVVLFSDPVYRIQYIMKIKSSSSESILSNFKTSIEREYFNIHRPECRSDWRKAKSANCMCISISTELVWVVFNPFRMPSKWSSKKAVVGSWFAKAGCRTTLTRKGILVGKPDTFNKKYHGSQYRCDNIQNRVRYERVQKLSTWKSRRDCSSKASAAGRSSPRTISFASIGS